MCIPRHNATVFGIPELMRVDAAPFTNGHDKAL